MPILSNNRRERFCQGIAKGLSATESYRQAGYKGNGHVAEAGASEILRNPEVVNRLAELQAKAVQKHEITVETLTARLLEIDRAATADGQHAAATAALALVARMHGFLIERHAVDITHHKPAPLPTKQLELSESEWRRQFEKKAIDLKVPTPAIAAPGRNGRGHDA